MTDISITESSDGPPITGYSTLPDPWLQGLGIFDLTTMEWKEEYDPAAAPYVTPDAVKAYYQRNGRGPASWTNDIVQAWFTETTLDHTDPSNYTETSNHTESSNHTDSSSAPSIPQPGSSGLPGSSKGNIGAIAGGTTGGVLALALIALGAFGFLRRHLLISRWTIPPPDTKYRRPEVDKNGNERIPGVDYRLFELQGISDPAELPAREVATTELPCGVSPKELPA